MEQLAVEPQRGGFQRLLSAGKFIRDYLSKCGNHGAPTIAVHRSYKAAVIAKYAECGKQYRKRSLMTYQSFCQYFERLKLLNWIEPTSRTEPSKPQQWNSDFAPLTYYRLTKKGKAAPDSDWSNPVFALRAKKQKK